MRKRFYNPYFTPMQYSPALWLDASDQSTLIMDGARTFASASTQYLYVANNSSVQAGNVPYWFSCWVKLNTLTGVFACKAGSGTTIEWQLSLNGANKPAFDVCDGASTVVGTVFFNQALSTGTWYHILVYLEPSTSTVGISLNGGAFATASLTGTPATNTQRFVLGAYGGGAFPLNGSLDSCAFGKPASGWLASNATALRDYLYNGGSGRRSSDFMASSYYTGGNPSGAVSFWDMDARSGNETDRIGSNNLTDNGGVGYASGIASGIVQYTGDPVKQWSDKSGNARHVTAASDAARPTYTTAAQNGLSGITFDGINDALTSASFANAMPRWLFLVAKISATKKGIFQHGTIDHNELLGCHLGTNGYYADIGDGTGPYVDNATAISSGSHVVGFEWTRPSTNAILTYSLDGTYTTPTVTNPTVSPNTSAIALTVGARETLFFPNQIYEVIYGSGTLSQSVSMQFVRYLGNKWGITVA